MPHRVTPLAQVFDPTASVSTIGDAPWHLRAEEVPPEEEGLDQPGALHVHCLQVTEDEHNVSWGWGWGVGGLPACPACCLVVGRLG